jgi:replicative DNA helicase
MALWDYNKIKRSVAIDRFLVERYNAKLTQEGREYITLCCFHGEKTPSMRVKPREGKVKCFGGSCQKGGDIFDVVQHLESVTKYEAAKLIVDWSGLDVPEMQIKEPEKLTAPPVAHNANPALPASILFPGARPIAVIPPPLQNGTQAKPNGHAKPPVEWPKEDPRAETTTIQWTKPAPVAHYPYREEDAGKTRHQIIRIEWHEVGNPANYKKKFQQRWQHEDGAWVWGLHAGPYVKQNGDYRKLADCPGREKDAVEFPAIQRILFNADKLVSADEVYLVEGEKDALTLEALGFVSTTASGGSSAPWEPWFNDQLRGKRVVHIPDNGSAGQKFADVVQENLTHGVAQEYVRVSLFAEYGDITEYLDAKSDDPDVRRDLVLELVARAEQEANEKELKEVGFVGVATVAALYPGGVDSFLDYSKRPPGVMTGIDLLDDMTRGLQDGELIILAARPAMGKTALLLNWARYATFQGLCVPICAAEMSKESVMERCICSMASVSYQRFKAGASNMHYDERTRIRNAYDKLATLPLLIDDTATIYLDELHNKLSRLTREHDIGFVGIDYLQLVAGVKRSDKTETTLQRVTDVCRNFKVMAREIKKPFVVLSQLSRGPETRPGDNRPQLSDLRDSGTIEQDADMVAFIFREEVYRPDKESVKGIAELILAKQRNGPTGRIKMKWESQFTSFLNMPHGQSMDHDDDQEQYRPPSKGGYSERRYPN